MTDDPEPVEPSTSAISPTAPTNPAPSPRIHVVKGPARIDDLDDLLDTIASIGDRTGAVVQAFDADLVVSEEHLRRATRLAARAISRGEAVAREPAVEVLLYAAGRRQIDRALELGVSEGDRRLVSVVADFGAVPEVDRPTADLDGAVESMKRLLDDIDDIDTAGLPSRTEATLQFDDAAVRQFFGVTDRELAATDGELPDVVLERVALLDVSK